MSTVLDDVERFCRRFIVYPNDDCAIAHSLWIGHTHLMDVWFTTPRLSVQSPEYGDGKTRVLEVTSTLTPRTMLMLNPSPSSVFRRIGTKDENGLAPPPPTLLVDEVDAIFAGRGVDQATEDLRSVFNSGYRRGFPIPRSQAVGNKIVQLDFETYCAVAMAGRGGIPQSLLDRSVIIPMRHRAPDEYVESWRDRIHIAQGHAIRDRLADWAASTSDSIRDSDSWPEMPQGVEDRAADIWEPLLVVARAVGGRWPDLAQDACIKIVKAAPTVSISPSKQLLHDIRQVFGGDLMFTAELIEALKGHAPERWCDAKEPLNEHRLAQLLKPHGIEPEPIRADGRQRRGYRLAMFGEAWRRYPSLSLGGENTVTSVTTVTDAPAL